MFDLVGNIFNLKNLVLNILFLHRSPLGCEEVNL